MQPKSDQGLIGLVVRAVESDCATQQRSSLSAHLPHPWPRTTVLLPGATRQTDSLCSVQQETLGKLGLASIFEIKKALMQSPKKRNFVEASKIPSLLIEFEGTIG